MSDPKKKKVKVTRNVPIKVEVFIDMVDGVPCLFLDDKVQTPVGVELDSLVEFLREYINSRQKNKGSSYVV